MTKALGRVLVVAGSDSGGGAGIQADIKTIMAMGGYACTAITAVTAQNTLGVHGVLPVPPDFVTLQIAHVMSDIGADAIKTGMLGDAAMIEAVTEALTPHRGLPFVLDPVMVAKGGHRLLAADAVAALKRVLLPLASLITPNLPEAEVLCGTTICSVSDMRHVADMLLTMGVPAALIKGGHLGGEMVTDVLATESDDHMVLTVPRQAGRHTHGTGCTLASAIAAGLAQGMTLAAAVQRAHVFVQAALRRPPGLGAGHGPLDHRALLRQETAR